MFSFYAPLKHHRIRSYDVFRGYKKGTHNTDVSNWASFIFMTLIIYTGAILAVYCMWLLHAITCPFSKYCQILYIFAQIFKYFAFICSFFDIFHPFLPFFWKIACMPLLSRIGPDIFFGIIYIYAIEVLRRKTYYEDINK